jgi:hypothetical protein
MKAWLKYYEANEWYWQDTGVNYDLWFCKHCSVEVVGEKEVFDGEERYLIRQDCGHAPRSQLKVPVRFISLTEHIND